MENNGFMSVADKSVDVDSEVEVLPSKPKSKPRRKKFSVRIKQASMELSEFTQLSQASKYTYGDGVGFGLHIAVRNGELSLLDAELAKLQKESDNIGIIDALDKFGFAALHHTTRFNRIEATNVLLNHGADVNVQSGTDVNTPLHIAAR